MSFEVISIDFFDKQAKRLVKKYPSLKNELEQLRKELASNPKTGTPIGFDCYKIRLGIASKNRGKSGGARVITNVYVSGETIFLLSIYDKAERQDISDKELKELLKLLPD
jgi:mRNA-degrading endonuclease RelE of RelBE toxin-antitoxin system